jgi:hypothetical protein
MAAKAPAYRGESQMIQATEDGSTTNGFLERHRSAGIAAFLAVFLLLALSCVCLQVTGRIGYVPHPTPAFPTDDLLLDESPFPEGWRAVRPFDPDQRLAAEQTARHLLTSKCHPLMVGAGHEVYRFYAGARAAAEAYPEQVAFWFSPNVGDWIIDPELSYESPVADQFRYGCYIDEDFDSTHCVALGQYEQYVVVLDATLDPDHPDCLRYTDLEKILIAIDEKMALYLGKDIP